MPKKIVRMSYETYQQKILDKFPDIDLLTIIRVERMVGVKGKTFDIGQIPEFTQTELDKVLAKIQELIAIGALVKKNYGCYLLEVSGEE